MNYVEKAYQGGGLGRPRGGKAARGEELFCRKPRRIAGHANNPRHYKGISRIAPARTLAFLRSLSFPVT